MLAERSEKTAASVHVPGAGSMAETRLGGIPPEPSILSLKFPLRLNDSVNLVHEAQSCDAVSILGAEDQLQ